MGSEVTFLALRLERNYRLELIRGRAEDYDAAGAVRAVPSDC